MTKLPFLPTVGKSLKNSLSELYQAMGYSFITSLVWFLAMIPVCYLLLTLIVALPQIIEQSKQINEAAMFVFVISLLISTVNGLLVGPVTTALFGLYQERKTDCPNLKSFFKLFKQFYWLAARVFLVFSLVVSLLVFNLILMLGEQSLLIYISGVFSFYGLCLSMLLSFYFHPLIFYKNKFKDVFKKAFLLLIDNLGVTFGFGMVVILLFLASVILLFPLFLLFGAFYIYFMDNGFELIYRKYERADENLAMEE
ncbi:MAG TPA: hypothetical protein VIM29_11165 [Bacillota bacterium]